MAIDGPVERTAPGEYRAWRRGKARLKRLWQRHSGPLGLAWRQRSIATDQRIVVLPDIRMRPTGTGEGTQIAAQLRAARPEVGEVELS